MVALAAGIVVLGFLCTSAWALGTATSATVLESG